MLDINHRFSVKNAVLLADAAILAYENANAIQSKLPGAKVTFISDSDTDTQCFVAEFDKYFVVAFRGTEGSSIKDWGTDLNARFVKMFFECHEGFYYAYHSVSLDVLKVLEDSEKPIFATGHSLGGALATLFTAEAGMAGGMSITALYTYGCPRVFSKESAEEVNDFMKDRSFRIVNNNDVVSRVPPRMMGFSHTGQLKYIDADGKLHPDEQLSWWDKFWDRIEGRVEDIFDLTTDGVGDHLGDAYKTALADELTYTPKW